MSPRTRTTVPLHSGALPHRQWRIARAGLLCTLAAGAWFVIVVWPYLYLSDWAKFVQFRATEAYAPYHQLGFAVFLVTCLLLNLPNVLRAPMLDPRRVKTLLTLGFFAFVLATTPFSLAPKTSLLYAAVTFTVLVLFSSVWENDYREVRIGLGWLGLMVALFVAALFLIHGLGDRTVGAIQPNQLARTALVVTACGLFFSGTTRFVMVAFSLAVVGAVSSRASLVAFVMLVLGYYLVSGLNVRKLTVTLVFVVGLIGVELASTAASGDGAVSGAVRATLHLDDPVRGWEGGFTGRFEIWSAGVEHIARRPLVGYGFRTRETADPSLGERMSAHNGFLNLVLDVGIVGGALILLAFGYDIGKRLRIVSALRVQTEDHWGLDVRETRRLNTVVVAFSVTFLATWAPDPQYLNLGHPYTLLFMFLFTAPYFVQRRPSEGA